MVRASRHFVERRLPWLRYTAEILIGSNVRFTKSLFQGVFTSSCVRSHNRQPLDGIEKTVDYNRVALSRLELGLCLSSD